MVLNTPYDKEFYLTKAREFPLIKKVISGETTFTERLEEVLTSREKRKAGSLEQYDECLNALVFGAKHVEESLRDLIARFDGQLEEKTDEDHIQQLYRAANIVDLLIGRCFIFDNFHDNRPCFERTYAALPQEERASINDYLFGLLGAGGIPGMDEIWLNGYLSGLLEPKAGARHDGTRDSA